jgi:HSP20 family protein
MTSLINWKGKESRFPFIKTNFPDIFGTDTFFDEPSLIPSFWENRRQSLVPSVNIRETDKEFVLELAAPGMEKKDFMVDVCDGYLEVKVEKETTEKVEEEDKYTRREYNFNSFYRSFYLPETLNADKIKAEYINGILTVHLPKIAGVEKKKAVKEIKVI